MKKVLLSAAALFITGLSFGQVKWGVVAGPSFSSFTYQTPFSSGKKTSDLITSFRGGFTADVPLADDFYIQPSLLYAGKGGKTEYSLGSIATISTKTQFHYLELPVDFMYKAEVGTGSVVVGVGPYFAAAVGGKREDEELDFDSDGEFKRFDAGGNLQFGYELSNGLNFMAHAEMGFVNIYQNTDDDRKFRNTSFGVSVGYKFGR